MVFFKFSAACKRCQNTTIFQHLLYSETCAMDPVDEELIELLSCHRPASWPTHTSFEPDFLWWNWQNGCISWYIHASLLTRVPEASMGPYAWEWARPVKRVRSSATAPPVNLQSLPLEEEEHHPEKKLGAMYWTTFQFGQILSCYTMSSNISPDRWMCSERLRGTLLLACSSQNQGWLLVEF